MDSKQHFFIRLVCSHFFVPSDSNVQVLKCEDFNGSLFYYVRWSNDIRDVTYLNKEHISIIVDCMFKIYGDGSHSCFSWKCVLNEIYDETNNFSSL